jgi:hypothetical protein
VRSLRIHRALARVECQEVVPRARRDTVEAVDGNGTRHPVENGLPRAGDKDEGLIHARIDFLMLRAYAPLGSPPDRTRCDTLLDS